MSQEYDSALCLCKTLLHLDHQSSSVSSQRISFVVLSARPPNVELFSTSTLDEKYCRIKATHIWKYPLLLLVSDFLVRTRARWWRPQEKLRANWAKLKYEKNIRHRLSQTAVASQFSWPRTWCAGWFGQIDFQTITRIRGSTTGDYQDERRSGVWSVEQQRNLWVQQLGITSLYLHLASKVEKIRPIGQSSNRRFPEWTTGKTGFRSRI